MTDLAQAHEKIGSNSLCMLVEEIKHSHETGMETQKDADQCFAEAGRRLIQAKSIVKESGMNWLDWVAEHFSFDQRTAQRYMALARKYDTMSYSEKANTINGSIDTKPSCEEQMITTNRAGPRIKVPEGILLSQLCRDALKLQANGMKTGEVAEKSGIGIRSYRMARDIVQLADRSDLNEKDAKIVHSALTMIDGTQQIQTAHDLIKDIAKSVWGGNRNGKTDSREAKILEKFDDIISLITESCEVGANMTIPHLSAKRSRAAIKEIKDAISTLRKLQSRFEEYQQ